MNTAVVVFTFCLLYLLNPCDVAVIGVVSNGLDDDELDKDGGIYKTVDKSGWRDLSDPWAGEDLDEIAPLKQDQVDKTAGDSTPATTTATKETSGIIVSKEYQKREIHCSQKQFKRLASKLKECEASVIQNEQYSVLSGLTFFRQLMRAFKDKMRPLENEEHKYGIELMMFEEDYTKLRDLLDEESPDSKQLLDIITEAFQPLSRSSYAQFKGFLTTQNLVLVLASFLAAYVIHQLVAYPMHLMGKMVYLFMCVFIVSVCWEYYRMYKVALAEKTANIMKLPTPPEQCSPIGKLSELDALLIWVKDRFTFADDECVKYHENLLVDPLWEVSPIVAISVCASRFLLEPMKLCASSLGQCFRLFFKEVPLQWQPVLFITGVCLVVLFILTHAGLEIWTPLLRLGFKTRVNVEALENENRRLLVENETMRREINHRPHKAIEEVGEHALGKPPNGHIFRPIVGDYSTPVIVPSLNQPIEEVGERVANVVPQIISPPLQQPVDVDVGEPLNDPIEDGADGEDGSFREPVQEESVSIVNAMELTSPTTNIPTPNAARELVTTLSNPSETGTAPSDAAGNTTPAPSNAGNEAISGGGGGGENVVAENVGVVVVSRNSVRDDYDDDENGDGGGAVGFEIIDRHHPLEDSSVGVGDTNVTNDGNGDADETSNGVVSSGVNVTGISGRRAVEHSETISNQ